MLSCKNFATLLDPPLYIDHGCSSLFMVAFPSIKSTQKYLSHFLLLFIIISRKKSLKMNAETLHWLCSVPVGITIASIGILGNTVSIRIWYQLCQSKLRRNKSTAHYFIWLAVCDMVLLLFFLLQDSLPNLFPGIKTGYYFGAMWCWFLFPMFFFSLVASIWMVVGITMNRFIMITFPTRAQVIYSQTRSKLGIFGIILFAFLVNLPHFFSYHVVEDKGTTGDVKGELLFYRINVK